MNTLFADTLRKLRTEKGLSQIQLANQMIVNKATVSRWENGIRLPDAAMITRLSEVLGVDVGTLLNAASESEESPNIIMVDDSRAILTDSLSVLEEVVPNSTITGFIWPKEAIEYAKINRVALAILNIELGTASGLDLCSQLLEINPRTNVVYLTAYPDYSLDAWNTDACGFMVKPLNPEDVRRQLHKLRYPIMGISFTTVSDIASGRYIGNITQKTANFQPDVPEWNISSGSPCHFLALDFTGYLRKNFAAIATGGTVPFPEELEHARAYLAVEQVRFDGSLYARFNIKATQFRTPPLTLQPIVENAVKHGMDSELDPLHITVSSKKTDHGNEIVVEDTGIGFAYTDNDDPHVALDNIRRRLEITCGGTLSILPRDGGGTRVVIFVPDGNRGR